VFRQLIRTDFSLNLVLWNLYRGYAMEKLYKNQQVSLVSSKGVIQRVVVEDLGDIITVTTSKEMEAARLAGRQPAVAGFPKADLSARTIS
jgi:hypothetical protein